MKVSRWTPLADRLWPRTDRSSGCWLWLGGTREGYGAISVKGRTTGAHVVAWQLTHGRPVPPGQMVDHLCHNRRCINPHHLRVVTPSQNQQNRRGASRNSQTGVRNVYPRRNGYIVKVAGKYIGDFQNLAEAEAAAVEARRAMMPFSVVDQAA